MDYKAIAKIFLVKIVLPTWDIYSDWYIIYQLFMGQCFQQGQKCSDYYEENHVNIAMIGMIFPIISWLFHFYHWWEIEKIENGGHGRLKTLPLMILNIWPQFCYFNLIRYKLFLKCTFKNLV